MMKSLRYLCTLLLLTILGVGGNSVFAATTYKLQKVTSVEAGGLYVFEQSGVVMTTVSSKVLQITKTYNTTGLKGSENYVFTLESATASDNKTQGFKMKNMSLSSNNNNNSYIGNTSSKTDMTATNSSSAAVWAFTFQEDQTVLIQNLNNSDRFLGLNQTTVNASTGYKAYATNNMDNNPHAIVVYKLVEESSLPAAGLVFAEDSYAATLGESFTAPTLTNPNNLSVTYASSNTDVATVDANTGAVTLVGAGTTTITASFAGNDTYAAGEASYTLTVKKAPVVYEGNYFVKVTSTENLTDGAYLIVYEGGNVAFNGGLETLDATSNTIVVSIDGNGIEATDVAKAALFVWDSEVGTLQSISGYYIGKTANSNGLDSSTETAYTNTISFDNGNAVITASGNCVLRYNKTNGQDRFRFYKSGQEPIAIYKLTTLIPKVSPELSFGETTEFNINFGDEFNAPTLATVEGFDGTVTYSSDNPEVATVNAAGEVEIKGVGTAVITASSAETEHFTSGTSSYTIKVVKVYSTIADFKALEDGTVGLLNLTGAQVVFVDADKKNIYVRDNSGAIALFNNKSFGTELKAGDVLIGTIEGQYTLYKNLPEITNIENISILISNTNEPVVPKEIAATKEAIGANVCDLVKITKTQITEDNSKYFVGTDVQLYDKFGAGYTVETAKNVDVIGVATIFDATYEISPRTANDIVYYPAAPTFSPASGAVEQGTPVTITVEEGATIKYTVNGEEKTSESNSVEVPVTVDTEITAVAVKNGLECDPVTASYSIPRVASIGDVEYFTFAEALGDATEDDIITLLADVAEPYTLTAGQTLKLNLNGHAITINAPEGYELKTTLADGITTYTAIIPVAKIGDTMYASLAEAIAAVSADGLETTITMIADETIVGNAGVTIPAGKNVVLNLNGKTISQTGPMSGTSYLVKNNGTLTIMDSSDTNKDGTGTGKMICTAEDPDTGDIPSYATNLISNYGVLNIESGYYQTLTNAGYASYVVDNYTGGTANISGGKLCNIAPNAYVVRMFLNSTSTDNVLNISGTTVIEGSYAVWMQYANANANKGTLNISGGTISATNGRAVYAGSAGGTKRDASNINVSISGGTINGTGAWFGADTPFNSIIVTGGEFADFGVSAAGGSKFVTGGTYRSIDLFTQTRTEDTPILADGYVAVKQGDVYVVIPESTLPAAPIIFHDAGEYESELQIAMAGEGTIMYTLNDGEAQTYSAPFTITEDATIKAWAVKDGVASDVTEPKTFTIKEKAKSAKVDDGYYTIQNNEGKYVNVAGRKTVTLVSDTKSAGTVIRVKADEDGVKVLRSQAVDLPRYAERAMSYVPEIVKEVVKKLAANVNDPIIGEQGADLILDKFNKEFDYHLYLEGENNTYRIYGRTPSMKPVVDFYAENKELVDSRLPKVEDFVKEVLQKIVDKVHRGQSVVDMFKVKTVWKNMGGTLTDPDVDQAKFFEEVLTSEENVWSFAYQTGMLYWDKVESYLNDSISELGDYGKYIEKIPQIRPNFKYYIVPGETGLDIISEGNEAILNDNASAAWTLTKRESFDVTLPVEKVVNIYPTSSGGTTTTYNEYYGTLYTDFAYQLPADVVAYKIDGIDVVKGKAYIKKTKLENILPAQTPVMLVSNTADIELTLVAGDVAAVSEGELRGNDFLINEYEINSSQAEGIMMILQKLSESLYNEYEHLQRRNAGTVNNKYFFGLAVDPDLGDAYKAKTGKEMESSPVRILGKNDNGEVGFFETWNNLAGNEGFMFSEEVSEILMNIVGDVNRDGKISVADVNALVEIVLGKATYPADADKYDFEAADVNTDKTITISDVTALVNIILGK